MTGFTLERDGALLAGVEDGTGPLPVLFQHGLGGDRDQVAETMPALPGIRRLTLECRAQGASAPGDTRPFGIALFADDVLAACDARGFATFVAGGISMGAAIALRLAATAPERVRALVLARPAWAFEAAPATMRPYAEVADLLRRLPPAEGRRRFAESSTGTALAARAPANLSSLLGFFDRPDLAVTADLLDQVAADGPGVSRAAAAALRVPTLVIGHAVDEVHPLALARELADTIPGARLATIPPKATDKAAHLAGFRAAVEEFLAAVAAAPSPPSEARS